MISNFLLRSTKSIFFKTPLWRYFLPVMKFDMSLVQLQYITEAIASVKEPGAVAEIGVGGGATSVMINLFMKQRNIKREFYAIDTFFGFTKEDIQYEKENRGKTDNYMYYRSNKKEWYTKALIANGITDAKVFKEDAKKFDYSIIGPLAFCLFDVDLFQPTEYVLPRLYDILVPGGVIIIDDCSPEKSIYDGAGEAYRKFCEARGIEPLVVHEKLGVLRKPLN